MVKMVTKKKIGRPPNVGGVPERVTKKDEAIIKYNVLKEVQDMIEKEINRITKKYRI